MAIIVCMYKTNNENLNIRNVSIVPIFIISFIYTYKNCHLIEIFILSKYLIEISLLIKFIIFLEKS